MFQHPQVATAITLRDERCTTYMLQQGRRGGVLPGHKIKGDILSARLEAGYQAPVTAGLCEAERIYTRVANLRSEIITKFNGTWRV